MDHNVSEVGSSATDIKAALAITHDLPVYKPSKYDGKGDATPFLVQLELFFMAQATRFVADEARIALFGSCIVGDALTWFTQLVKANGMNFPVYWLKLRQDFQERFATTADRPTAVNQLINIRQLPRERVMAYANRLHYLANIAEYPDPVLQDFFLRGLRTELQTGMITVPRGNNLADSIKSAIALEVQQEEMKLVIQRSVNTNNHRTDYRSVDRMQVDVVKFKALTTEEKQRRRAEGLCLYCGLPGHIANRCPEKKSQPYKTTVALAASNAENQ